MEHMTAQEALEAAKGITFEKAWAIMQEDRRKWEEERRIAEAKREEERRIAEAKREEERRIAEAKREEEEKRREEERRIAREQWEKEMAEFQKSIDKSIGRFSNSLGDLTEAIFSGALYKKFEEYGYDFISQAAEVTFVDKNKRCIAEVDIWLEDGKYAMAVEVKLKPKNSDIDEHIERIGKIRELKANDKRTILGAIAGGVFKEQVMKYAYRKGLYVIVQSDESVMVEKPPKSFKPREWGQ